MSLAASLAIAWAGRGAARRFDAATRDPMGAQRRKLTEILARNSDTEYGLEHGFSAARNHKDYAKAVPVVSYNDIEARVTRMTAGEKNILTAEDPVMFARTSGTTGTPKFIPVTPTCQGRDHSDQSLTWVYHAKNSHPAMFSGRIVSLVSPAVEGQTKAGVPYGSTSGHMYRNMPRLVRGIYAIPYEVFEIEDYDAKYYILMRISLAADVTFLSTANPSSIVKMCEVAHASADLLLKDLADGTLRKDLEVPKATRQLIEGSLRPLADLARRLGKARDGRGGKLLPVDYWPNLALIGCWKGGTVGSYVERLQEWFDPDGNRPVPVRDWGYLSSEARGSIPLSDDGCGGVLTVATNVYEFVEIAEVDKDPDQWQRWTMRAADELEVGKEYYIFITTTGGLYRYDMNDVITVTGHYNKTPVIVFNRKGRGVTSITGEKLSVNHVIEAVGAAAKDHGIMVDHFRVEADMKDARYIFLVESAQGIVAEKRLPFLESVEQMLSSLNLEYEGKRKSQRLKHPILHVMKTGWYDHAKQHEAAEGKRVFQSKTVLLAPKEEPPADPEAERQFLLAVVAKEKT